MLCMLYHSVLRNWYTLAHSIVFVLISIFWPVLTPTHLIFSLCARRFWMRKAIECVWIIWESAYLSKGVSIFRQCKIRTIFPANRTMNSFRTSNSPQFLFDTKSLCAVQFSTNHADCGCSAWFGHYLVHGTAVHKKFWLLFITTLPPFNLTMRWIWLFYRKIRHRFGCAIKFWCHYIEDAPKFDSTKEGRKPQRLAKGGEKKLFVSTFGVCDQRLHE